MYEIKLHPKFDQWLSGLSDIPTRVRLARRIDRLQQGLVGDVKSLGSGLYELREHFGPGWRLYFFYAKDRVVVLLAGGSKSRQGRDIELAKKRRLELEEGEDG